MPATTRTHKSLTVSAIAVLSAAFLFTAPQPAAAGKKTDKVLLGVAAGAAGIALLHALSKKKKKAQPPVVVAQPPPPRGPRVYTRPRPRPPRGYYPRPRPPVYAPRPRAQYSANTVRIQQSLAAIGYNAGIADGLMGRSTRAAIRQYQSSLGQNPTGYMTPYQQNALFQRAAGVATAPAPAPVGYPGYRPPAAPAYPGYTPQPVRPSAPGYRPPVQPTYPVTGYPRPPVQPAVPGYRPPTPYTGVPGYRPPVQPTVPGYRPPVQPTYPAPAVPGYRPISAVPGYPAVPSRGRGINMAGSPPSRDTTAALRIPAPVPAVRRP